MTNAFYAGFSLGFSLIVVIGAQNAFVLRQGLKGEHVLMVCLICGLSDAVLVTLGVSGFNWIIANFPKMEAFARYGGAVFLCGYGARCFYTAYRTSKTMQASDKAHDGLATTALICVALTWLNPHVYLDTVVLLGSISTQYQGEKFPFALGAILASFTVFFSLGYGARIFSPAFSKPISWKVLDVVIGVLTWAIAFGLLFR